MARASSNAALVSGGAMRSLLRRCVVNVVKDPEKVTPGHLAKIGVLDLLEPGPHGLARRGESPCAEMHAHRRGQVAQGGGHLVGHVMNAPAAIATVPMEFIVKSSQSRWFSVLVLTRLEAETGSPVRMEAM